MLGSLKVRPDSSQSKAKESTKIQLDGLKAGGIATAQRAGHI